jgi:hypothetical protein
MEELKLILDTLSTVSGDALTGIIWYLVLDNISSVLWFTLGMTLVLKVTALISDACRQEDMESMLANAYREKTFSNIRRAKISHEELKRLLS